MNSQAPTGTSRRSALAMALTLALGTSGSLAGQKTIGTGTLPTVNDSGNFTMLQESGAIQGGTNDVLATWDGTVFDSNSDYTGPTTGLDPLPGATTVSNMTLVSTTPFSSAVWTAHDIQVFAPGTYTFDATLGGGAPELGTRSMTVGPDQLGVHMLFDWNGNGNIDVLVVWDLVANQPANVFGSGVGATTDGLATCGLLGGGTGSNCLWDGAGFGTDGQPLGTHVWEMNSIDDDGDGTPGIPMAPGGPFAGFNASFNLRAITGFAPIANDDQASSPVAPNGTLDNIDVLGNDLDVDGTLDPATVTISNPTGGTGTVNGDGTVNWTDTSGTAGTDTFTYTVDDNDGNTSEVATVSVIVGVGELPVANDDDLEATEDEVRIIDIAAEMLINDTDAEGPVTFDATSLTPLPVGTGTLELINGDTQLRYTPPQDFDGTTSYTYNIKDSDNQSALTPATVTIDVLSVNDPPIANDDAATTNQDEPVTIDVLANDVDVDDTVTIVDVGVPVNGGVAVDNPDGTITYTPASGFSGTDQFTYTIGDGSPDTSTATVTVTVLASSFVGTVAPADSTSSDITGGSNFTMLTPPGDLQGGTNDVVVSWDGTLKTDESDTTPNMQVESAAPTPFSGFPWFAHDVRVFGPGTYTFEACLDDDSTRCELGNSPISMEVGANQIGIHMLFDWGQPGVPTQCGLANCNIDVVQVMDISRTFAGALNGADSFGAIGATFNLVSGDGNDDGISGIPMVDGAFRGFNSNFNFNLTPQFALPGANLSMTQGGNPVAVVVPSAGPVTITATPSDAALTFDWDSSLLGQQTDAALLSANTNGTTNGTFVFDPAGLVDALYNARVTVTDPSRVGKSGGLSNYAILPLQVDSTMAPADAQDDDGDGIPNGQDASSLPATRLQTVPRDAVLFVLESGAGSLELGNTAREASIQNSGLYAAGVTAENIGVSDPSATNSCVGGCFDFKVTGLAVGTSVDVVVPLSASLSEDAAYRMFFNEEWHSYSLLDGNAIASAPGSSGNCPAPGDAAYQSGLNAGDFCVQLTLVDGGRNDADGIADGIVTDPGGVSAAVADTGPVISSVSSPKSLGNACTIAPHRVHFLSRSDWLLVAALIGWLGWTTQRRGRVKVTS